MEFKYSDPLIRSKKMERVSIFIEGTNLHESLVALEFPTAIDYRAFGATLAGNRALGTIYFYSSPVPAHIYPKQHEARKRLFDSLRNTQDLVLKLGSIEVKGGLFLEKGVHAVMAVDLVDLAHRNSYDTAIVISRSGEFCAAVEAVKSIGKGVENVFFRYTIDPVNPLAEVCDSFRELTGDQFVACKL